MKNYDFADDPLEVEAQQIAQRRKLAEILAHQSGPAGGPIYSNKAGIARLLGGMVAGIDRQGLEEKEMALAQRRQSGEREEATRIFDAANAGEGGRAALAKMLAQSTNPAYRQAGLSMVMQKPKEDEPYTLREGEVRYGSGGKILNANTKIEKPDKAPDAIRTLEGYMERAGIDPKSDVGKAMFAAAAKKASEHQPATNVNVNGPKETFKNEKTLRDEFTDASKSFVKVRDAYSQVRDALAGDITAPATLTAATKFMKMLDPESVVRESELNMALKSTGLLDRFMNLHNTVMKGGVLTPAQATEIQRIAGVLYSTSEAQQKRVTDYYTKLSNDYKLDPSRVVRDLSPTGAAAGGDERANVLRKYGLSDGN